MQGTFKESIPKKSPDTSSATSSPVSAAGRQLSLWQDGQSTDPSGPDHAHANRSQSPGRNAAKPTNATCGRSFSGSSASVGLQRSLENRLRARMDCDGSMEYSLTWKALTTPAGRSISRLRASRRRMDDNAFAGWPTPNVPNRGKSGGIDLQSAAFLTGWPTPAAQNADGGVNPRGNVGEHFTLQTAAGLVGWNTPRATDGSKGGPNQAGGALPADAALVGWSTPTAEDHRRGGLPARPTDTGIPLTQQVAGLHLSSSSEATARYAGSALNPAMSRWLMGFLEDWDVASPGFAEWQTVQERIASGDCGDTGTPSSPMLPLSS